MFDYGKSQFRREIKEFLKTGGSVTSLPPQELPDDTVTAQPRNAEEIGNEEFDDLYSLVDPNYTTGDWKS